MRNTQRGPLICERIISSSSDDESIGRRSDIRQRYILCAKCGRRAGKCINTGGAPSRSVYCITTEGIVASKLLVVETDEMIREALDDGG